MVLYDIYFAPIVKLDIAISSIVIANKNVLSLTYQVYVWGHPMEAKLLDVLACPICRGKLEYDKEKDELICRFDRLAFQVVDGVPIMLEDEARKLSEEE